MVQRSLAGFLRWLTMPFAFELISQSGCRGEQGAPDQKKKDRPCFWPVSIQTALGPREHVTCATNALRGGGHQTIRCRPRARFSAVATVTTVYITTKKRTVPSRRMKRIPWPGKMLNSLNAHFSYLESVRAYYARVHLLFSSPPTTVAHLTTIFEPSCCSSGPFLTANESISVDVSHFGGSS